MASSRCVRGPVRHLWPPPSKAPCAFVSAETGDGQRSSMRGALPSLPEGDDALPLAPKLLDAEFHDIPGLEEELGLLAAADPRRRPRRDQIARLQHHAAGDEGDKLGDGKD